MSAPKGIWATSYHDFSLGKLFLFNTVKCILTFLISCKKSWSIFCKRLPIVEEVRFSLQRVFFSDNIWKSKLECHELVLWIMVFFNCLAEGFSDCSTHCPCFPLFPHFQPSGQRHSQRYLGERQRMPFAPRLSQLSWALNSWESMQRMMVNMR